MKATKSKTVVCLAVILAIVIVFKLYGDAPLQWIMCIRWHLSHDDNVTIGTAELKLPSNWWITEREEKKILLNRVTPIQYSFFGQIFIMVKDLGKDDLNRLGPERDLGGMRATRIGDIETSTIDGETTYSVKYRVISSGEEKDTIVWTLSVPSQRFVINVLFLHEGQEPIISSELIPMVRFVAHGVGPKAPR